MKLDDLGAGLLVDIVDAHRLLFACGFADYTKVGVVLAQKKSLATGRIGPIGFGHIWPVVSSRRRPLNQDALLRQHTGQSLTKLDPICDRSRMTDGQITIRSIFIEADLVTPAVVRAASFASRHASPSPRLSQACRHS